VPRFPRVAALILISTVVLPGTAAAANSENERSRPRWPWLRPAKPAPPTLVHPAPQQIIARDHSVAAATEKSARQKEIRIFEARHRTRLREYVETRVALAVENARYELLRQQQQRQIAAANRLRETSPQSTKPPSEARPRVLFTSLAPPESNKPPATPPTFIEPPKPAAPKPPQIIADPPPTLADANTAESPQGAAFFLSLLLLHMPSVAIASFVVGVVMIRGHRTPLGTFFLALAAILGAFIFFVMS